MHITSVEMTDFRSHTHLDLTFDSGVNALIGSSNTGKSNVFRALRWCLTNQPTGTDMIRVGAKEARVTVHLSNGYAIERVRGRSASNNFYRLYRDDTLVEEFTAFGTGVPEAIRLAHGMSMEGENSMNFHDQLETAFLVASSPSARATYIGNLDELAKVDRAQTGINDELRDRAREAKRLDQEIHALGLEKERLEASVTLGRSRREAFRLLLDGLTEEARHEEALVRHASNLAEVRSRLDEAHHVVTTFRQASEGFPDEFDPASVNRLFTLAQEARVARERIEAIKDVAALDIDAIGEYHLLVEGALVNSERLGRVCAALDDTRRRRLEHLPYLSDEVAAVVNRDLDALGGEIEQTRMLFRHHAALTEAVLRRETLERDAQDLVAETERLLDEMLTLLVDAGHCATCGQETAGLTHACIEQTI